MDIFTLLAFRPAEDAVCALFCGTLQPNQTAEPPDGTSPVLGTGCVVMQLGEEPLAVLGRSRITEQNDKETFQGLTQLVVIVRSDGRQEARNPQALQSDTDRQERLLVTSAYVGLHCRFRNI